MKHISRRFGTVLIIFLLLILGLVGLTQVSAAPLVTTGVPPGPGYRDMIGIRWRSLANTGGDEMYLGISGGTGGGLGAAANRTARQMTWQATNQVAFIFDRVGNIMTGTMTNGTGTYVLGYPSVPSQLTARGVTTKTVDDLNVLQITVVNREYPTAGVLFQNVHLDGYPLGTFGNASGFAFWTVNRHLLHEGFVLTGTVVLSGTFSISQENCRVEVSVGSSPLGNIEGTVWFDYNQNTSREPNEPPLGGIGVNLTNAQGNDADTTDAGAYRFPNLFLDQGYVINLDPASVPFGTMYSTASQYVITPTASSTNSVGNDFGIYGPGSIGDWVWYDGNGDGVQDPGELGLSGVLVNLTSGSGLNVNTSTDSNGYYTFTNLLLDDYYTVTANLGSPYYSTTGGSKYAYLDASNTGPRDLDLGFDSDISGIDARKMRLNGRCCAAWDLYYYIVITNNMASPITNAAVKDLLPPEIAPYSVQTGFGPPSARVPGGTFDGVSVVVWNIASIAPGTSQWVWFKARTWSTAAGRTMVNQAWVASDQLGTPIPLQETSVIEVCYAPPPPTPTPTPTPPPPPPGTTVVIKKGGPGTSLDTYIYRNQPYSNYWLEPLLKVGYKQTNASLIQFDLSPIPAGAKVDEAWLEVWAAGWSGPFSDMTIGAYAISQTVQISQTTWVSPELGSLWTLSGANDVVFDRRAVPESTVTTSGPLKWYRFDVARLVQEWLDGGTPNNGALLRCESCAPRVIFAGPPDGTSAVVEEGADAELAPSNGALPRPLPGNLCPYTYFFASSENANAALWPRLVVRYE